MKKEMIINAMAYNKYLTKEYLNDFTFQKLLALCHPIDRADFIKRNNLGEPYDNI